MWFLLRSVKCEARSSKPIFRRWIQLMPTEEYVLRAAEKNKGLQEQDDLARLVRACGNDLSEAQRVHSLIVASKHRQNKYLANLLVQMYGKCGSIEDARRVFDGITEPNAFSWNMIMTAYSQNGQLVEAKCLLERMPNPNATSWTVILAAYAQNGHLEEAKSMFDRMPEKDAVSWNSMIAAYGHDGHLVEAKSMFDKMPESTVVSWTTMLSAYTKDGHLKEASKTFERMPQRDVVSWTALLVGCADYGYFEKVRTIFERMPERNMVSWNSMVAAYAHIGHLEEAKKMFDTMPEQHVISWTVLLAGYAENGCLEESKSMFDKMVERDVVSWNVMIAAYSQHGDLEEAKRLFDAMSVRDAVSWTTIFHAFSLHGLVGDAKKLFDKIPQQDMQSWTAMAAAYASNGHLEESKSLFDVMPEKNAMSWTTMVAASAQNGYLEEARSIFDAMKNRGLASWNAMVAAYAQNGLGEEAINLFQCMVLEGVKPDEVTFISVLAACNHVGLLKESCCHFTSMCSDYGITPWKDHYCCIIDILGRAGQLKDAVDLVENMPFLPDEVAWGSLLSACRVHRDVERGTRAAEQVFELDPHNAAAYVCLANMYAKAGRQLDVARVRKKMADRRVRRQQPGMSSIVVDGKMHRFKVGDTSHPRTEDIYVELQRLSRFMKDAGYVPDAREVLQDVGEEDKKLLLCSHSERLAIAFGLLSAEDGASLRIVKNLRVCSDCHTAIKLISKIVGRKILVRDASRFHRFEDGECSCQDYW